MNLNITSDFKVVYSKMAFLESHLKKGLTFDVYKHKFHHDNSQVQEREITRGDKR